MASCNIKISGPIVLYFNIVYHGMPRQIPFGSEL
jgi:hypothetical protein